MSSEEMARLATVLRLHRRRSGRSPYLQSKTPASSGTWRREAGIYLLLFGTPLLLLFPYTGWRPDARFQAILRTDAVNFRVGPYNRAGLFVCRCADISLDAESFSKVDLSAPARWHAQAGAGGQTESISGGRIHLRHVDFQTLLVTPGTLIKLRWNDNSPEGVLMRLIYAPDAPQLPAVHIGFDKKSSVEFSASRLTPNSALQDGVIASPLEAGSLDVYPAGPNLALSVNPCGEGPTKQTGLPPADNISLAANSDISFADEGDSGILEGTNSVEVKNADRKEPLFRAQRLEIASVKDRSIRDHSLISLQVKNGIIVNIVGRAGIIRIDGEDARPSLAEYLRSQKTLSVWLATAVLIGSALLTIVNRVKLVKLDTK